MRDIKVKVSNDRERDAVLRQFERDGLVGGSTGRKPTKMNLDGIPYPYYIFRTTNPWGKCAVSWGFEDTASVNEKEVPASTFLKLDKDVITITSDGKIVTAESNDGRKGIAKCSPDDEFSLKTGAKLALDRMFGLQVGDKVRCTRTNCTLRFADVFLVQNYSKEVCARFAYGQYAEKGCEYEVIGVNDITERIRVAVVENSVTLGSVHVINVDGLEKI